MSSPEAVALRLVEQVDAAERSDDTTLSEAAAAAVVATLEQAREAAEEAAVADALAFALLHSLPKLAQASRCASAHVGRVLELLASRAPPRDALALFLEALVLWPEEETGLRAQLVESIRRLCQRQRRPQAAASHALPSVADAAVALLASEDGEAAAAALRSCLALACSLSDGAGEERGRRLQLRLLGTLGCCTPEGASGTPFLGLRTALAVDSWAALRLAAQPSEQAGTMEEEEEESVLLGAGLLAHAWLSLDGAPSGEDQWLAVAASLSQRMLEGCVTERAWGGRLVSSLARRLALSGGCGDESALGSIMAPLCAVLCDPQSGEAAPEAFTALGLLLDAATPWTRLRLLRQHLKPEAPADAVAALLFARLQTEAARGWGSSPFGAPVALQLPSAWLLAYVQQACADGDGVQAEGADAAVGAINALRFCLLRAAAAAEPDVSGWREPAALETLRRDTLEPLIAAAERSLEGCGKGEDVGSLLALQTLLHCAAACSRAAAELQRRAAAVNF